MPTCVGALSKRVRPGIVIAIFVLLVACTDQPESGTVPVEIPTGNGSSRSLTPIETSIYTYDLSLPDLGRSFRITAQPPLRFAFPAAYYTLARNFQGGPQASIRLGVDPVTFGPSALTPTGAAPRNTYTPKQNEEHDRRFMSVTVYTNLIGSSEVIRGTDGVLSVVRRDERNEDRLTYVAIVAGLRFHSFDDGIRSVRGSPPPRLMMGSIDLNGASYYAYPERPQQSLVQAVKCEKYTVNCLVVLFYEGRQVGVYIEKKAMTNVTALADRLLNLLDRYNIDRSG